MHLQARKGWHYSDVVNQWDYSDAINQWHYSDVINQWDYFSVFELSRSMLCIKKAPNQAKIYHDLIKMVSITLEGLWIVFDMIVNFQFFIKFHRSGPAITFSL